MDLDLTKPSLWISVLIGALVVAAASAGFQHYNSEEEPMKIKGVIRDAILGGIFVAMAWTLVPESMESLTEKVTTSVSSAATTVATSASTAVESSQVDVQVGPARF